MNDELRLVEVVVDEVGSPRNDGTAGSGLYPVPIQLSRRPSGHEAELLVRTWDHPPRFSTMHRPGTARVVGDRLVLGATTIEEVETYHVETLNAVIESVNREEAALRARDDAQERKAAATAEAHQRNVEDVASRIKFD